MDDVGTVRLGASKVGDYHHGSFGIQVSDRLYLGVRQSMLKNPDTHDSELFPGMDLKYRLFEERSMRPEITLGFQSVLGHKRMAAEYLALSKRYHQFDFTAGIGWGRLGTQQSIPNPLLIKSLSSSDRDLDGDDPSSPAEWFRGDAGLFGGVEYDVASVPGLSVKADLSSNGWDAEKAAYSNFNVPAPWSLGFSYRPMDWLDIGAAMIGRDQIMARISFSPNVENWRIREAAPPTAITLEDGRPDIPPLQKKSVEATSESLGLKRLYRDDLAIGADLDLQDHLPSAFQIGQGARHLSNIAGDRPEKISFHLSRYGLRGPSLSLNRRDIEMASRTHQGSAEEIWRNTLIDSVLPEGIKRAKDQFKESFGVRVDFKNDLSLSEEDSGSLFRSAVLPSLTKRIGKHFITENALRINLVDNLNRLEDTRGFSPLSVRSDIHAFTRNRILFERQYLAGFVTLGHDIHLAGSMGYLEEMYAGALAEILYRPFDRPWALGLEMTSVAKRDPSSSWALAPAGEKVLSGFINGYYEIPNSGATLQASVGRFLAGDVGGEITLKNELMNGVVLTGVVRGSNRKDFDPYGGKTNLYTGLSLSMPLGSLPFIPDGSRALVDIKPLGRDTAQRLDNPVPLYSITEPMSYRSITRHWSELMHRP